MLKQRKYTESEATTFEKRVALKGVKSGYNGVIASDQGTDADSSSSGMMRGSMSSNGLPIMPDIMDATSNPTRTRALRANKEKTERNEKGMESVKVLAPKPEEDEVSCLFSLC